MLLATPLTALTAGGHAQSHRPATTDPDAAITRVEALIARLEGRPATDRPITDTAETTTSKPTATPASVPAPTPTSAAAVTPSPTPATVTKVESTIKPAQPAAPAAAPAQAPANNPATTAPAPAARVDVDVDVDADPKAHTAAGAHAIAATANTTDAPSSPTRTAAATPSPTPDLPTGFNSPAGASPTLGQLLGNKPPADADTTDTASQPSGLAAWLGGNAVLNTLAALGCVLAAVFGLRWAATKLNLAPAQATAPADAVQVLARTAIAPRNHVLILRVGSLVLVVNDSPQGMNTLASIDDPQQADDLVNALNANQANPGSSGTLANGFGRTLEQWVQRFAQPADFNATDPGTATNPQANPTAAGDGFRVQALSDLISRNSSRAKHPPAAAAS